MAINYLKRGKPEAERARDDTKVRNIVETILGEIESNGDAAVRALSVKFDNYSPESFKLSEEQIEGLVEEALFARTKRYSVRARAGWQLRQGATRIDARYRN